MVNYDKSEIRKQLSVNQIFEFLEDWGGEPMYTSFGIISATICHNPPGEGSRKLYFYENSGLFHCYTGCADPSFDIFELIQKVFKIQKHKEVDLNESVRWIAQRFGIQGTYVKDQTNDGLDDWKYLANYDRIQNIDLKIQSVVLKEYNPEILSRFHYDVRIDPWLKEGITQEVLDHAQIGFYPGGDQITIPHFDKEGRFVGLRGRCLCAEEGQLYGKYKPLNVNNTMYNHPLGFNLYNLNNSKSGIRTMGKAIVFEGEKSTLKYQSYFGIDNDISVACCGSSFSNYQVQLLLEVGAREIVLALDRQFQAIGDNEFKKLTANLLKLRDKYKNDTVISCIFDKNLITDYKSSPIDHGADIFLKLFKERIIL